MNTDCSEGTYTPAPDFSGSDTFSYSACDPGGLCDSATVTYQVNPVPDPPVAEDQTVTTDEDTSVGITLTASDADGDPLTYNIGLPTHGSLIGTAPYLTYTPAPNYYGPDSFTFVVNDGQTDSDLATVSIMIAPVNDPPSATFDYSCAALSCTFDASGSSDPEEDPLSYGWDFGDGQTGTGTTPSHTYPVAGTFSVILTVADEGGSFDTATQAVSLSEAPASLHVGDLDGGLASANKNFWWAEVTVAVHDQDEDPVANATVTGTWSGGASGSSSCLTGTAGTCALLSPKVPAAQGTVAFTVDNVLHATLPYQLADNHDPDGDSDGITIAVSQSGNQPPEAHFDYGCSGLVCTFHDAGSSDPDGTIISYEWDLGDGETATGASVGHTYTMEGMYTVVLTVTDDDNAADTDIQNVAVGVSFGTIFVSDITLLGKVAGPNRSATAVVTILDTNEGPLAGATVHGAWSGDYSVDVSGVTAADGTVVFTSDRVRQMNATFTFTVENVVYDGFTYNPALNSETSDTVVVP